MTNEMSEGNYPPSSNSSEQNEESSSSNSKSPMLNIGKGRLDKRPLGRSW